MRSRYRGDTDEKPVEAVTPLFREEVSEHQSQRLIGEIRLDSVLSHTFFILFIFAILVVLAVYSVLVHYPRTVDVEGWLVPDRGMSRLLAPDSGIITQVDAHLGKEVGQGMPLLTINSDNALGGGVAGLDILSADLDVERENLRERIGFLEGKIEKEENSYRENNIFLTEEEANLQLQLEQQQRLVRLAEENFLRFRDAGEEDAASPMEISRAEENLIAKRQELVRLSGRILDIENQRMQAETAFEQAALDNRGRIAELEQQIASISQRRTTYELQSRFVLNSPTEGVVTSLPVRVGQSVAVGQHLLTVLPRDGVLEAELYIPTSGAGFVQVGQKVKLRLDAFPDQKYGLLDGVISSLSTTVSMAEEIPVSATNGMPAYRATVTLSAQSITANDNTFPLQPGMQVRADIQLGERRLWQVFLAPVTDALNI